jgi:hypothetical protein
MEDAGARHRGPRRRRTTRTSPSRSCSEAEPPAGSSPAAADARGGAHRRRRRDDHEPWRPTSFPSHVPRPSPAAAPRPPPAAVAPTSSPSLPASVPLPFFSPTPRRRWRRRPSRGGRIQSRRSSPVKQGAVELAQRPRRGRPCGGSCGGGTATAFATSPSSLSLPTPGADKLPACGPAPCQPFELSRIPLDPEETGDDAILPSSLQSPAAAHVPPKVYGIWMAGFPRTPVWVVSDHPRR